MPQFLSEITAGAVGIWSLIAIVLVALIKAWPALSLQATQAREKLRAEGRSDLSDCKERIDGLQAEVTGLRDEMHHLEMKLLGTVSAYKLLDTEVETHIPDSLALRQARALMSTAFTMSPSTNPGLHEGREIREIGS